MKGKTVPCPACKNILLRYANFEQKGTWEMKCPHCQELVKVTIGQKQTITVAKVDGQ